MRILFYSIDCKDIFDGSLGRRRSGIYAITRPNKKILKVYCDMETDGGGWTVIQRRVDATTEFNRLWFDYKHGFGDLEKNMWIGLENIHSLAKPNASTTIRIEMKHYGNGDKLLLAKYDSFEIGNETDGYRIRVSGYSGTAGDAFNYPYGYSNNLMEFSTIDRDNDNSNGNCALFHNGAWWHNRCFNCNLNALFPSTPKTDPDHMSWRSVTGGFGNIYFSEMKIRRN